MRKIKNNYLNKYVIAIYDENETLRWLFENRSEMSTKLKININAVSDILKRAKNNNGSTTMYHKHQKYYLYLLEADKC